MPLLLPALQAGLALAAGLATWHFGALHAYERWLAVALAFGPFVILAVVIAVRRRQDAKQSDDSGPG
jgi:hypothetical protein